MSRVTAPLSKQLSRSVSTSVTAAARSTSNAGATLMPKYAELLRTEHSDSSRGITTTHRPTPQPSITNRTKPLMQTFHSSAPSASPAGNLGTTVLPSMDALYAPHSSSSDPVVPIMPDNFSGLRAVEDAPVSEPEVTIVAADPDKVMASSPFFEVGGLDIDVKFAHEPAAQAPQHEQSEGMIKDLWKGMVDDVLGRQQKLA